MDEQRKSSLRRRGVYILPNLMTTASMFAGFLGMTMAINGAYESAAWAVLVSCVLDGLDGKIARLTHTASEFGVQLDSLADLVAFGVTPALLTYLWQLRAYGRLGLMACFLFMACAALRLARFNVQTSSAGKLLFTGLPTPAAGCTLATLVLFHETLPPSAVHAIMAPLCLILAYGLSFLMVSKIRYFAFKEYGWFKAHAMGSLVTAVLLFVLVASEPALLLFPIFAFYMVSGIVYTFIVLPRRRPRLLGDQSQGLS
ncbi:CDP-diacylglycerol/serine O-phosphatidyltransferase [Desulfovibrio sp. X2]|uniref:CDP-diacylglycerol--serine O-phosphatidyltransferase n=1 Tax=Desulfovibrio sp. X2 TaxID=941449 RepID=UPI000358EFE0|nr:CDP-diacylglycerol--serine O-phosphatidyltransferase [Desulfovibrio sp. X2]EPR42665.1 CDP-diacylglycerol/serine O-phosphatidyltransferase [Desulfovibrio sp. X2]